MLLIDYVDYSKANLLRLPDIPISIVSSITATTKSLSNNDNDDIKVKLEKAKSNIKKLVESIQDKPFSHHSNEYLFEEFEFHVAQPLFNSFGKVLNPIIEKLLHEYVSITSNDNNHEYDIDLTNPPKLHITHYKIEMRDGVKLSTFVVLPQGAYDLTKKVPTMLSRSPYGPTSDLIGLVFTLLNGHACVIQDQRGTFLSEGHFSMWQKDAEDGYDTMEWIVKQPWSNSEVFGSGISADGCGALTQLLEKPPHLKGQLIMWSSADGHKTSYPGGAFREGLLTGWMGIMSLLTKGYSLTNTLPDILAHEQLGPWWDKIETVGKFQNVKWPMIHLAGWWDIFQGHQLEAYDGFRSQGDKEFRDSHTIIVSPMGHCLLGNLNFNLARHDAKAIINGFGYASEVFKSMSQGKGPIGHGHFGKKLKRVNFYVQGSIPHSHEARKKSDKKYGNYWSSLDNWPKYKATRLYIAPDGRLLDKPTDRVSSASTDEKLGANSFIYVPTKPAITHGGNNLILIFLGMGCGSMDQRNVEARSDVLVYTTEPLKEAVAITGPIKSVLHVSSNRNDTDFHVSVTDVHPDGASMQVRFGIQRMRWRESTTTESKLSKPMTPGYIYKVEIDLWRTSHIFAPGHSIRMTISSSNTPYYSRNDDFFHEEKVFNMDTKSALPAENRVHWKSDTPSYIELPIVSFDQIPENPDF